jgi:hypothetical protein
MPPIFANEFMRNYTDSQEGQPTAPTAPTKGPISANDFMRRQMAEQRAKEGQDEFSRESRFAVRTPPASVKTPEVVATKKQETKPSTLADFGRGIWKGVSFDNDDEIAGALRALQSVSGAPIKKDITAKQQYQQGRDESRQSYREAEQRSPVAVGSGEFAGAMGPAVMTGGASLGPRLAGYAAQGAVRGLGSSESDTIGGDLLNAAGGATTGLVAGSVGEGLGAIARPFMKAYMPSFGPASKFSKMTQPEFDAIRKAALDKDPAVSGPAKLQIEELKKYIQTLQPMRNKIQAEAEEGATKAGRTIGGMTEAAGTSLGGGIGGVMAGPTGVAAGGYLGNKIGSNLGEAIKNSLAEQAKNKTLPGSRMKDIDSEALARVFNAIKNQTQSGGGRTGMAATTPIFEELSGLAGGGIKGVGDSISGLSQHWDNPKANAEQELDAQNNPAAREEERRKRSQ